MSFSSITTVYDSSYISRLLNSPVFQATSSNHVVGRFSTYSINHSISFFTGNEVIFAFKANLVRKISDSKLFMEINFNAGKRNELRYSIQKRNWLFKILLKLMEEWKS